MRASASTIYAAAATLLTAAAIAGGLTLAGAPSDARARRLDQERSEDLQYIAVAVRRYYSTRQQLPETLEQLRERQETYLRPIPLRDPVSKAPYEYRATGSESYELCANFDAPADDGSRPDRHRFWIHGAGRHCFRLNAG